MYYGILDISQSTQFARAFCQLNELNLNCLTFNTGVPVQYNGNRLYSIDTSPYKYM